ncbi:MAG: hypothetical protein JSU99_08040, partial [Nitrospiraceae bacterium]
MEDYHHKNRGRGGNVFLLFIILIALAGLWWYIYRPAPGIDPDAVPRTVVARGDLALDEKNTIELFEATSEAVVYITSIELRRNIFSLNIYEIPQG